MDLRRQILIRTWRDSESKEAVVVRRERGVSLVTDAMAPVTFHDQGYRELPISCVTTKRIPGGSWRSLVISRVQENLIFRRNRGEWPLRLVRAVAKVQGGIWLLSHVGSRSHYKRIRLSSRHYTIG